jgi:cytochrome c biogenesis protein CcmG, thiol:disulfide interchange protein DsbE
MHSDSAGPSLPGRRALLKGALAGWLAAGVLPVPTARANELRVGAPAPPATLVTLDGKSISTSELRGQVVILTFWATWCVPCREELPLLSEYAQKHADRGLTVLGFGLDTSDRIADVRKVAADLHFPVGFLASSRAPGYGRIWRLPVNFTIDRAGRLAEDGWKEKAPSWTPERLGRLVTPLLG